MNKSRKLIVNLLIAFLFIIFLVSMIILLVYFQQHKATSFNITYNLAGGTNSDENPITYDESTKEIILKNASKDGYTFDGWYLDSSYLEEYDAKALNGNATVYAKFTPIEYSITYNLDNGTNSPNNPTTYTVETSSIFLENPTKENYTFLGWYKEAGFINKVTKIAKGSTGNIELFAKWEENQYTITFDTIDGSIVEPIIQTYNTPITAPNDPIREMHMFKGWFIDEDCTIEYTFTTMPKQDITLYAKWIKIYTITYVLGEACESNSPNNPSTYTIETNDIILESATPITHPDPQTYYEFAGWYSDDVFQDYDHLVMTIPQGSTGDVILYARWTEIGMI